jgi:hypothetical protein
MPAERAGDPADLLTGAPGGDEAKAEIGFAGGFVPGYGFANDPAGILGAAAGSFKALTQYYGTTNKVPNHMRSISACDASSSLMNGFALKMDYVVFQD